VKILFIGGNGNISWHCVAKALSEGHEVWTLNRGATIRTRRAAPADVVQMHADMRDPASVRALLKGVEFDVIADFICFTREQALVDIDLFRNRTGQFIFISSTSIYQRPAGRYPLVETSPLGSPQWDYARNKIVCEQVFLEAHGGRGFPVTIVRPAHTYDTLVPDAVGNGDWTVAERMLAGKPVLIHGDGSALWTVTHAEDFAAAFVRLFGQPTALGEAFHITSDEWLTWRQISDATARALGVDAPRFVYVPSDLIAHLNPDVGKGLLGHKTWSDVYDNSKIKSVAKGWRAQISFEDGIRRTIEWLRADRARQRVDSALNQFMDDVCYSYLKCCQKMCLGRER